MTEVMIKSKCSCGKTIIIKVEIEPDKMIIDNNELMLDHECPQCGEKYKTKISVMKD
jgi:hypothetical protein